jgi:hypothetical protein
VSRPLARRLVQSRSVAVLYAVEVEAVEGLRDRMLIVMQHCRDPRMAMQER